MDSLSYIYLTFDKKEESAKNMGTTLISCCIILKKYGSIQRTLLERKLGVYSALYSVALVDLLVSRSGSNFEPVQ